MTMKFNKKPTKQYLKNLKIEVLERDNERCVICGAPKESIHHVYGGRNRKVSNEHVEFMVCLCWEHHQSENGSHGRNGHWIDVRLKWEAQQRFEETHTREEFMQLIGRSYL